MTSKGHTVPFQRLLDKMPRGRRDSIKQRSQELLEAFNETEPAYGPETQKAIEEMGVYGYVPITNELVKKVDRILNIVDGEDDDT